MLMMMMIIVRNKDNCILNNTAPVPWPSPLTRVVSLDSLSPVLSLTSVCGSWQTPLSWSHHLSPHWTSLWARDSAQSSRARVTSSYSHCELSLPSAGDQISGLDHFVDGSEFRTRDLSNLQKKCLFGSKTVFLGQEVHYYMVYIAYFTELDLQICDYAQKRHILRV